MAATLLKPFLDKTKKLNMNLFNVTKTDTKLGFFGDQKSHNRFSFSTFFVTKTSNFNSNINDDFQEDSFEVYTIYIYKAKLRQLAGQTQDTFNFGPSLLKF